MMENTSHLLEIAVDTGAFLGFCLIIYRYAWPTLRSTIDSYREEIAKDIAQKEQEYQFTLNLVEAQEQQNAQIGKQIKRLREEAYLRMDLMRKQEAQAFHEQQQRLVRNWQKNMSADQQNFVFELKQKLWQAVLDKLIANGLGTDVQRSILAANIDSLRKANVSKLLKVGK